MKKIFFVFFCVISTFFSLCSAEKIFDLTFDDYTVTPQTAKGSKAQKGFTTPDLQLRMSPGIQQKGNALILGNQEKLSYEMKQNFNPEEGTVILWIAPQNWEISQKKYQLFFYAEQPEYNLRIAKIWPNYITANIQYNIPWQGKKYFGAQVQARLDPVDWKKGRYHQVVVTWTDRTMHLYIDGKRPAKTPLYIGNRNVAPTVSGRKFTAPVKFPKASGRIHLGGNRWIKNKHTDPAQSTGFDRVTIYDKALSAEQILREYEKIVPPVKKESMNLLTIPALKGNGKLTGDLSDPVWQKAVKMPILPIENAPDNKIAALIWHDNKDLHVGFSSELPCQKKNWTKRDQNLWEDDVFEFHLRTANKNYYHYILNGNGAIFDQLNGKAAWNSNARTAVKHNKNGWTAELVIPLSEFNAKEFDGEFAAGNRPGILYHLYRWGGTGKRFQPAGKMILGKTAETFRLDGIGTPDSGKLDLQGFSTTPVWLKIMPDGEKAEIIPVAKGNFRIAPKLLSGRQTFEISANGFLVQKEIVVRQPLNLSFDFRMWNHELKTQIDFSSADDEIKKRIQQGLAVRIAVKNKAGKSIVAKTSEVKEVRTTVPLMIPADLPAGEYTIEGNAGQIKSAVTFHRPDLAPYKAKLGSDHTVPVPWTPVKQIADRTFQVWGRTYEFNHSPLPQQIIHGKDRLLTDAPVWTLDGNKIQWTGFKLIKKAQDKIVIAGNAKAGKITFNWQGELWFDGAYILNMELIADGIVSIQNLGFTYAIAPVAGRYAMHPGYVKWQNNKVALPLGPGPGRKDNILWISGEEKGILFWTESNANWVTAKKTCPLNAERMPDKTKVGIRIINKGVKLSKKAAYRFVFMATPTRPFPERYRAVNYGGYTQNPFTTHQSIGWGQFENAIKRDDPVYFNTPYPADGNKLNTVFETYRKKNHARLHYYTMPGVLSDAAPDAHYWSNTLKTIPEESYSYNLKGVRFTAGRYCTRVTSLPADYWTWTLNRLLSDFPEMGGLYFDCSSTNFCSNEQHGCSGIDAFGQPYFTSDALGLRDFMMRLYKIHKRYPGKTMMLHSHVQFVPFLHSFTDFFAPGENSCEAVFRNPEYPYIEEVSPEEYQTDYNSRKAGVAFCMILQNARAAGIMPSLSHYRKKYKTDPEYAIRSIMPFLLHDVNIWDANVQRNTIIRYWKLRKEINMGAVTRFIGYWEKECPVKTVTPNVYASVYEWKGKAPYRRVIAVGNFTRRELAIGLKIDWNMLGIAKPEKVRELWTGNDIPVSELANFKLKGSHFALFGIQ